MHRGILTIACAVVALACAVASGGDAPPRTPSPPPAPNPADQAAAAPKPVPLPTPLAIKAPTSAPVVFIPLHGIVGEAMLHSIERRLAMARDLTPALLVFELNTYGGGLDSALAIADIVFGITDIPTVAYVNDKAISAGALIATACGQIVMHRGSTLGDCQPVNLSGEALDSEKIDTVLRARFRTFCEGKYPPALAEAMVTKSFEVYEVQTLDGKNVYLLAKDYQSVLHSPEQLARYKNAEGARKVVGSTEILTMTNTEAKDYGFSAASVESSADLLKLYGLQAHRVATFEYTWSEKLVRLLDAIGPILLGLGVLGILIELKTPGFGFFGIAGLTLIALFFFGKYAAGLADAWKIILFAIGLVLLLVELFVTPGFGILGIAGLLAMMISVLLSFQTFIVPSSPQQVRQFEWSVGQLGIAALIVVLGVLLISRYLHRTPYLGRIVLASPPPSTAPTAVTRGISAPPAPKDEAERARQLIGRRGKAVSMLRPAGRADFDGKPLDVVTEGDFIAPGEAIEICAVHGNRLIVRRAT